MFDSARRGTVYGTLLNHTDALAALGAAVHAPPYKAPPNAPVLYIKPRNTWVGPGEPVVVPAGIEALEIGATLGLVIGRTACCVPEAEALSHVAGLVIVNDVSVPHASYYRPSLRFKARDTFCPIGPFMALFQREPARVIAALRIVVEIDGDVVQRNGLAGLIRPPARLLAEVSEFMTLAPGDVLSLGVAAHAPRVGAGQRVRITIDGLGTLENPFVAEEAAP
jgi:5-oxopent-3-ene-1,2,5-tricarboxylate decarboxylase / 2-hydroxyhepta-2,4-diene-1,7-dioate isomerase